MTLQETIEKARLNDKEAFEYLVNYYKPIFVNYVITTYGIKNKTKVTKELSSIIKDYLDMQIKESLYSYLIKRVNNMFKRKTLLDLKKSDNDKDKEKLIIHYAIRLYDYIKTVNKILTEMELENFCYDLIENKINDLNNEKDFLCNISNAIYVERKRLKTEGNLYLKYCIYEGINERVLEFLISKNKYILNDYEKHPKYKEICKEFNIYVKNAILMCNSLHDSLEKNIKEEINKNYPQEKLDVKNIRNLSKENIESIKFKYSYIKEKMFEKYKEFIPEDKLRIIVEEKYEDFFYAFVNGSADSSNISKYICSRFGVYLDNKKKNYEWYYNNIDKRNSCEIENYDLVYRYLDKFIGYYPLKNEIEEYYYERSESYFLGEKVSCYRDYVYKYLAQKVNELNKLYDINYIKNITNEYKKNSYIPKDIRDNYYDNLEKYYLENELYKYIPYDKFLFKTIRNYNETEYNKIKNSKDNILVKRKNS